jgi:hypothetical protein
VLVSGLLLLILGLVGLFFAVFPPIEEARIGALGAAIGCGLSGALLTYLAAPGRREETAPGMERGKATILDARATPGSVAGYQMVELTLEVRPQDGAPFQVRRKVSSGRLGTIEVGRELDVIYDPINPKKVELA